MWSEACLRFCTLYVQQCMLWSRVHMCFNTFYAQAFCISWYPPLPGAPRIPRLPYPHWAGVTDCRNHRCVCVCGCVGVGMHVRNWLFILGNPDKQHVNYKGWDHLTMEHDRHSVHPLWKLKYNSHSQALFCRRITRLNPDQRPNRFTYMYICPWEPKDFNLNWEFINCMWF